MPSLETAAASRALTCSRCRRSWSSFTTIPVPPTSARALTSGCSGAKTKNVTPQSVSGRVVNTGTSSPVSSIEKVTSAP